MFPISPMDVVSQFPDMLPHFDTALMFLRWLISDSGTVQLASLGHVLDLIILI